MNRKFQLKSRNNLVFKYSLKMIFPFASTDYFDKVLKKDIEHQRQSCKCVVIFSRFYEHHHEFDSCGISLSQMTSYCDTGRAYREICEAGKFENEFQCGG